MSAAFKSYSDLSIREAVLGVLRTKDEMDSRIIHTSGFRNAISELGLSFASKTVQNVLVHCKMDNEGSEENCTVLRVWHLRRNIASPFPPRDKGKEVKHILFFTK